MAFQGISPALISHHPSAFKLVARNSCRTLGMRGVRSCFLDSKGGVCLVFIQLIRHCIVLANIAKSRKLQHQNLKRLNPQPKVSCALHPCLNDPKDLPHPVPTHCSTHPKPGVAEAALQAGRLCQSSGLLLRDSRFVILLRILS